MTPKDKAIELVNKFKIGDVVVEKRGTNQIVNINAYAKLFALIAVDEILKENLELPDEPETIVRYLYWQKVKNEINNL